MTRNPNTTGSSGAKGGVLALLAGMFKSKSPQAKESQALSGNFEEFARRTYLQIESHRIIYCPIEKNACTYFKRLLLNHSECAQEYAESGLESHTFINQRRKPLLQDLSQLHKSDYLRFVVVREPIGRVVSAYLNKFVLNQNFRWAIDAAEKLKTIDPSFTGDCDTVTFRQFVKVLVAYPDHELDVHWRPQSAFFDPVLDCFEWLVPMNRVADFVPILEDRIKAPLAVEKTHNQNHYQEYSSAEDQDQMCDWTPIRLRELDRYPSPETLASGEIRQSLAERYQRDSELCSLAESRFDEKLKAAR